MSYVINNTRGNIVAVVPDGTVNTSAAPVVFVGRGVTSYGTYENDNYLWLLENFANPTPPPNAVLGQLWYNSANDTLNVYDSGNSWVTVSGNIVSSTIQTTPIAFASLPNAATAGAGTRAFITDSNSTTFNGIAAGGGSNGVPVFSDGINWRVG